MRHARMILFCILWPLALGGCPSAPDKGLPNLQLILDTLLPADFTGDVAIGHDNPALGFTLDAGDVHRGPKGWTFTWLDYNRTSRLPGGSTGRIRLGNVPALQRTATAPPRPSSL